MKASKKEYINLLPGSEKKTGRPVQKSPLVFLAFTLAWLAAFCWQTYTVWDVKRRLGVSSEKRQSLEKELAALQQALGITNIETNPDKAALVNTLLEERVSWSDVFREFSYIVPKGLWFDSLEGSAGDRREIRIRGGAFNYLSVSDFMLAMKKSGYFQNPRLSYAQKVVVQRRDVVGFEIECGIKKNKGRP